MAFRLKLVPAKTNIDFFRVQWLTFGLSIFLMVASIVCVAVMGLNFGIDFKGGTTIRTESTTPVEISVYRDALDALQIGDVSITEVTDPAGASSQYRYDTRGNLIEVIDALGQRTHYQHDARGLPQPARSAAEL